jgi:DNA-binding transcriptional LysR family regulator
MLISMAVQTLRDLELRHLSALRAVAETGSFGRAAARLGFSQSAVSQQIAALERIVGEPLFERPGGPRPVSLTAAGQLLLPHAVSVLDRVRTAEAELDGFRAGALGRLAVGTYQSVSVRILPGVLSALQHASPDLEIRLFESDDQDELLGLLRAGELDLTFVVGPVELEGIDVAGLCRDPFVLLCPVGSPIVPEVGPVPLKRLTGVPLIGQRPNACQFTIENALARAGVDMDITFRTSDNAAVQAMVRAGMGHAVMPALAVDEDDPHVLVRPLIPALAPRQIALARLAGRRLPPAADTFGEEAARVCAGVGSPPAAAVRHTA